MYSEWSLYFKTVLNPWLDHKKEWHACLGCWQNQCAVTYWYSVCIAGSKVGVKVRPLWKKLATYQQAWLNHRMGNVHYVICKCPLTELFLLNTKEKYTVQQSERYSVLLDRSKYFQIRFHKKGSAAIMAYCAYKRLLSISVNSVLSPFQRQTFC